MRSQNDLKVPRKLIDVTNISISTENRISKSVYCWSGLMVISGVEPLHHERPLCGNCCPGFCGKCCPGRLTLRPSSSSRHTEVWAFTRGFLVFDLLYHHTADPSITSAWESVHVVRCNRVARKRPARRNSRNGHSTHEGCFEVANVYVETRTDPSIFVFLVFVVMPRS